MDQIAFSQIKERALSDIYANGRASLCGSNVLREAGRGSKYYIDILEETKDNRLQLFEFKKVPDNRDAMPFVYQAIGQLCYYRALVKNHVTPHIKCRAIIVVGSPDRIGEIPENRLRHISSELQISTLICDYNEILKIQTEVGYREARDKKGLAKKYLRELKAE